MNEVQRNLVTAGIVSAAAAALIGGMGMRERVDERSAGLIASSTLSPNLLASLKPQQDIPEERYFYELMVLLKREYVEPITSELPLAVGSVKGMVSSLDDPHSVHMSKPLYEAFTKALEGRFEGIGARFVLQRADALGDKPIRTTLDLLERMPRVVVVYVAPQSPASKAGILPGDEIVRMDGRWVISSEIAQRYRKADAQVKEGKLPESAMTDIQKELRENFKDSLMPMRAFEKLSTGTSGEVELEWRRSAKVQKGKLSKAETQVPVNEVNGQGVVKLSFVEGASQKLKPLIESSSKLTLDLRGAVYGDLREMRSVLALLAPAGEYGTVADDAGKSQPLRVSEGIEKSKPIRVLVNRFTGGVAEAFVLALKSRGLATIEGGAMAGDPAIVERTALPDGSGFTLRVGTYRAGGKE